MTETSTSSTIKQETKKNVPIGMIAITIILTAALIFLVYSYYMVIFVQYLHYVFLKKG